jgi:hypothetical protein
MSSVIHLSGKIKFVSGKDIPVIKGMQGLRIKKIMNGSTIRAGGKILTFASSTQGIGNFRVPASPRAVQLSSL